jgi:hypothetical protein
MSPGHSFAFFALFDHRVIARPTVNSVTFTMVEEQDDAEVEVRKDRTQCQEY